MPIRICQICSWVLLQEKKNTHEVKYFLTGILHGIITKISTAPLLIPNRKWCECQLCNINKRNVEELLIAIDIYISLLSKFQDQMTKEKLEKRVFAVTQEAESRTNGKRHFTLPKSIKRWKLATASSRELLFWRTWKTPSYILLAEGEDHMKEHCVIIELTKITYVHIK